MGLGEWLGKRLASATSFGDKVHISVDEWIKHGPYGFAIACNIVGQAADTCSELDALATKNGHDYEDLRQVAKILRRAREQLDSLGIPFGQRSFEDLR